MVTELTELNWKVTEYQDDYKLTKKTHNNGTLDNRTISCHAKVICKQEQ